MVRVKEGGRCRFLDCEETARVRVVVLYSYPYEGRHHSKHVFRLCVVHAELLRRIISVQVLGVGLDEGAGSDDVT